MPSILCFFSFFSLALVLANGVPVTAQAPVFVFSQPNASTQWSISKTYDISWQTLTPISYISLSLYRLGNPSESRELLYSRPNSGYCMVYLDVASMNINRTYSDWVAGIENAENVSQSAQSQPFTIIYPAINIIIPEPIWIIDENQTIFWNTTGSDLVDYVSISLVQEKGNQYVLSSNIQNSGTFTWYGVSFAWLSQVSYNVKVCWVSFPSVCGISNSVFVSAPSFVIQVPSAPIATGGILTIPWTAQAVVMSVSVMLEVPASGSYLMCANITAGGNCVEQPLPYWLYSSDDYSIKICWDKYPALCGDSSSTFSIQAVIDLDNSDFDPVLVAGGGLYNLQWNTLVPLSVFGLFLCKRHTAFDDGSVVYAIGSGNMLNQHSWSYIWNATALNGTLESGAVYFLKVVVNLQGQTIYGFSRMFSLIYPDSLAAISVANPKSRKLDWSKSHTISWSQYIPSANHTSGKANATVANTTVANVTLPHVSIFLSSNRSGDLLVGQPYFFEEKYSWTPTKAAVSLAKVDSVFSWKVCYSSGLRNDLKCSISQSFNLKPGLPVRQIVLISGTGVGAIVLICCLFCICRACRRRRRMAYEPLLEAPHPPAAPLRPPAHDQASRPFANAPPVGAPSAPPADLPADHELCKICYHNPLEIMFLPCKHISVCSECSARLLECPVCKTRVVGVDRVYIS